MGQAEEVEVGPIRFRLARALCHSWAEIDEARLVGMEREPNPPPSAVSNCALAFVGARMPVANDRPNIAAR
jgi:hypothetical protein